MWILLYHPHKPQTHSPLRHSCSAPDSLLSITAFSTGTFLPTSEFEDCLAAPLVRGQFRHLPLALPSLCILLNLRPHRQFLLGSPPDTVLEQTNFFF